MKLQTKLLIGSVLGIGLFAAGLLWTSQSVQAASDKRSSMNRRCSSVVLVAHRGEVGHYGNPKSHHDENTMHSFMAAVRRGANEVETDLHLTKDGVWILMHDATVDRTTNGHGAVSNLTAEEIAQLKTTHGYPVPTLEQFITRLQDKNVRFQLELKPQDVTDEQLGLIVQTLQAHNVLSRVVFTSSDGNMLLRIKELAPNNKTGYIGGIAGNANRPSLATLKKYHADSVNISYRVLTKAYANKMHKNGIQVSTRSVANPAQYRAAVVNGANRIVTDHTKGFVTWCRKA